MGDVPENLHFKIVLNNELGLLEKGFEGILMDQISYEEVWVGPDKEFKVLLGGELCFPEEPQQEETQPEENQPEARKRDLRKMAQIGYKMVVADLDRGFRPEDIGRAILSVAEDLEHKVTGYGVSTWKTEKLDSSNLEMKSEYYKFQFNISKYLLPVMTVNVEKYQHQRSDFYFWIGLLHGFNSMNLVEEYIGRVAEKLGANAECRIVRPR